MIDLYIDGKRLDTDQQTDAAITLSIGSVEDPSQSLTAFSKSIEVPASARNKEIMQFGRSASRVEQFNNAKHPARLEAGGVVVMTGTAQITKVTVNNLLNASYEVNLIGAEYEWAKKAAEAKLNETDGLCSWVFSAATIKSLLESNGGVYLFSGLPGTVRAPDQRREHRQEERHERNVWFPGLIPRGRLPAFL